MSDKHHKDSKPFDKKGRAWVIIGAVILIILLMVWLTFADLTGNTDVAAFLPPDVF